MSDDALAGAITVDGHVTALRLFDLADAIDLARAETLWASRDGQGTRARLTGTPLQAVNFGEAPLTLTLPAISLPLEADGAATEAMVTARLYSFGVATIAVRILTRTLTWTEYGSRVNAMARAIGPQSAVNTAMHPDIWLAILTRLRETIEPALSRPNRSGLVEDYLIATVHSFSVPVEPTMFGRELDLVPLLSGETRPLSDGARAELMSRRFSYYQDDLVVLTWDRAFIYEPQRETAVADVIEVANAQFLQIRYYDNLLDAELPRMYDLVEKATKRRSLGPRRFAELARRLYTLVAEVTELTEKVDNALQVTQDVYLARVYAAALDLFRVKSVQSAVDRKLAIIRDTYTALYNEAASSRAGMMEAAIVALIALELILAVVGLGGR